jgi:chaperonin GroES
MSEAKKILTPALDPGAIEFIFLLLEPEGKPLNQGLSAKSATEEAQPMAQRVKPLHDRIIVKRIEEEEKSKGGIIIPDTAKEKPQQGKVVAVGPGKRDDGKLIPLDVKAGDTVLFAKYAGTDIKIEGEDHLILREDDVLGVVE